MISAAFQLSIFNYHKMTYRLTTDCLDWWVLVSNTWFLYSRGHALVVGLSVRCHFTVLL